MTDKEIYQLRAVIDARITDTEKEIKKEADPTMSTDRKIARLISAGILAAMKHINK